MADLYMTEGRSVGGRGQICTWQRADLYMAEGRSVGGGVHK